MAEISYAIDRQITLTQFRDVLLRSTLAERRPINDDICLQGMIDHTDILATAWDGEKLVGVSRSLTDWHYSCYLADLAVDSAYQRHGIGKQLIDVTQRQLQPTCRIILLAAPAANDYYPRLGFESNPRAWLLMPETRVIEQNTKA